MIANSNSFRSVTMGILEIVKDILDIDKEYPKFNGKNWRPAPHTVIKDDEVKRELEQVGYKIVKLNDQQLIENLTAVYKKHHSKSTVDGGMFYSLYSQDINYRKQINDELLSILTPVFNGLFKDYKSVINSFIIKHPGPKSEFYLHQDSTGLNEWKYSPVSFWMPLQETTEENGCMWLLPSSHKWFSPYRGISFPSMFEKNQDLLRPYLQPVPVKLGEVLLFDNRIVHLSGANNGQHPRVISMAGIFPKEAPLISCYHDVKNNGPLEIFEQDDDFLIKNLNFYIDCTARPKLGSKIASCANVKYEFTADELTNVLQSNHAERLDLYQGHLNEIECDIIQEPV